MENNFKALREARGLTLAELAKISRFSSSAINGLELYNEGSDRLKDKLLEILVTDSVKKTPAPTLRDAVVERGLSQAFESLKKIRIKLHELQALKEDVDSLESALIRANSHSYGAPSSSDLTSGGYVEAAERHLTREPAKNQQTPKAAKPTGQKPAP